MILFRVLRFVIYILIIAIILLEIIKLYEKYKVKNALHRFDNKVIALTFDDGPVLATKDIVDMLETVGIKATFFALGDETRRRPEILKYAYDHGHTIGNHSWSHPHFLGLKSTDYIEYQMNKAYTAIRDAIGTDVRFFRAPFGETSPWLNKIMSRQNVTGVHWTVSLKDWRQSTTKEQIAEVFKTIDTSEVILLHDRVYADTEKLDTLKQAILDLKSRGYTFITIDELYR